MGIDEIPAAASRVNTPTIAAVCLGGIVLAVAVGVLLYAFVRYVAA